MGDKRGESATVNANPYLCKVIHGISDCNGYGRFEILLAPNAAAPMVDSYVHGGELGYR